MSTGMAAAGRLRNGRFTLARARRRSGPGEAAPLLGGLGDPYLLDLLHLAGHFGLLQRVGIFLHPV